MSIVRPFAALRPPADKAASVSCPPYDVVNSAEAARYAKGNPLSFFHVSRPEIDLAGVDEHDDAVYDRAPVNLATFKAEGYLVQDKTPCFYLYRQIMDGRAQTGLVACASVDEYQAEKIKKHELTRADKEDDRTRHVDALGGNDEPVFFVYPARESIDAIVARICAGAPAYDFTSEDGIQHTLWVVADEADIALIEREFAAIDTMYIADGHHRSAAASRVRELRKGRLGPDYTGNEEFNFFMTVIFPHNQMHIMDYNRVVRDLKGMTAEEFMAKVSDKFEIKKTGDKKPARTHDFGMYLNGEWFTLSAREGTFDAADPVASLDVSILQENLLSPLLGIGNPRTDKRIDFVGGIRGTDELERRVDSGECAVAFSMFPTRIEELIAIADAGKIIPPKSTWFEPKLRSGLFLHCFD